MSAYRIELSGAPESVFAVGHRHKQYGVVEEIKETTTPALYEDGVPTTETCIVLVRFEGGREIQFNESNPYLVVYRYNE